jgi:hypothetical protein
VRPVRAAANDRVTRGGGERGRAGRPAADEPSGAIPVACRGGAAVAMGRMLLLVCCLSSVLAGAGCGAIAESRGERTPLQSQHLYQPHYAALPPREPAVQTLRALATDIHGTNGTILLRRTAPSQSGVLWLSLCLLLLVALNYERPGDPRNIDLVLMQASGFLFFEILRFFRFLDSPTYLNLLDWIFTALVALAVALVIRALLRVRRPLREPWSPLPPRRALVATALLVLGLNVHVALVRPPDDAGFFVNLGGQRLLERGLLPYGDPLLTETPAAAYGPVLYAMHAAVQFALEPQGVNTLSPDHPPVGPDSTYYLPPILATKLVVVLLHVLGVLALFRVARRLRGPDVAWALVVLYCGSAYVLGVGSEGDLVGGLTFVSHIAPASITLLAFAALGRPLLSGGLLAISIGTLFYPVFLVPAWLGYYWDDRAARTRFVTGLAVTALLIGGATLALSRAAHDRSRLGTVLHDTLGHQESLEAYGRSPFGFWGQRGGVRGLLMTPLVGGVPTTRPVVIVYMLGAAAAFFLTRRRGQPELALTIAVVVIGALLWKVHGTGTYVAWYYPFLLIGFLCGHIGGPGGAAPEGRVPPRVV